MAVCAILLGWMAQMSTRSFWYEAVDECNLSNIRYLSWKTAKEGIEWNDMVEIVLCLSPPSSSELCKQLQNAILLQIRLRSHWTMWAIYLFWSEAMLFDIFLTWKRYLSFIRPFRKNAFMCPSTVSQLLRPAYFVRRVGVFDVPHTFILPTLQLQMPFWVVDCIFLHQY